MRAALPFPDLLRQAGAEPPRFGRAKWTCPRCAERKTPALSVDIDKEVFCCHRTACGWSGNRRTLERELGMVPMRRSAVEVSRQELVQKRALRFQRWWRERLNFYRDVLWLLNDIERACAAIGSDCMVSGQDVPEWVFSEISFVECNRPHFEDQHKLFSDPARNAERLWAIYKEGIKAAA